MTTIPPPQLRELLADHPHARDLLRLLDTRPHAQPGWRQRRREVGFSDLARQMGLSVDAMLHGELFADTAPTPEAAAIADEVRARARDALQGIPAAEVRALALLEETATRAAEALDVCLRTVWNLRARALGRLAALGLSPDEIAALVPFLSSLEGDATMKPHAEPHPLASVIREMTADEHADHLAGYPVSQYRRRAAARKPATPGAKTGGTR
jgi:hypothetical protein